MRKVLLRLSFHIFVCLPFYSFTGALKSQIIDNNWSYKNKLLTNPSRIRYKTVEERDFSNPVIGNTVFVHGFGGNADQFRKNMRTVRESGHKPYAIDLLGFGFSEKPNPKNFQVNELYNFENWGDQIVSFVREVVQEPSFLVCNSVGGVAGLQAACQAPDLIKGVVLINVSLRMLHVTKQPPLARPFIKTFQTILRETPIGEFFFAQVAQRESLRNILSQAYADPRPGYKVPDEVVDIILKPGLEPGAAAVFLDFISYSGGPLPEQLLQQVDCPVRILWGERDPWEPITLGKELAKYPCVDSFVTISNGGHCPMDQVPDAINKAVIDYLNTYTK